MSNQSTAEHKKRYPASIKVDYGAGYEEIVPLHRVGVNGALYKTDDCLVYFMATDGTILPVLY